MRVNLEGREYWIEFAYGVTHYVPECPRDSEGDVIDVVEEHTKCLREVTYCILRDGSAPRGDDEMAPVLVEASVVRCYLDLPNRHKARKAALAKALDDLLLPVSSGGSKMLDKAERKLFWKAYLLRQPDAVYKFERQVKTTGKGGEVTGKAGA